MGKKTHQQKTVPAAIRQHLLKQEHSKKTIRQYCQEKGISPMTFYGWRKRYLKRMHSAVKTNTTETRVTFASLGKLSTQAPDRALFDIRLSSGISISVYPGTTAQGLEPFLSLLSVGDAPC